MSKTKNTKKKGGCLLTGLIIIGIFYFLSLILGFGWIAGIIWLIFFRKKMNDNPEKQKKYTIGVSIASVLSFMFFVYVLATAPPSPTKLELVSEYDGENLEINTDYPITIKYEPEDASLTSVTYTIDNPSLASITPDSEDASLLTLHTEAEGTITVTAGYSDIKSNTLTFNIINNDKEETDETPIITETSDNTSKELEETDIEPLNSEQTSDISTDAESTNDTEITLEQKNALKMAKSYLDFSAFSYDGLIEQLEFEKFSHEDAVYGADNCGADWNEQAILKAESYLEFSAFSETGLIEQLEFEGFTNEQATYGVSNCVIDWNEQAALKAKSYLEFTSFSREGLIDQLKFDGFTTEQATYGVEKAETQNNESELESSSETETPDYPASDSTTNDASTSETSTTTVQSAPTPSADLVWIDNTAAKYHAKNGCGMDNAYQVTKDEAIALGKGPCGRCYK